MIRWMRYFVPLFLFISLLAFQNCTRVHFSLDASADQQKSIGDSGNGGVYEGKPGTYYRHVPEHTCQGTPALHSSIEIQGATSIVLYNYPTVCDVKKGPVPTVGLNLESLNGLVVAYRDGIYEYSETPVGPSQPPQNPVEALCQNLSPMAQQTEVLVRSKPGSSTGEARVFTRSVTGNIRIYDFASLQRAVAIPSIRYDSPELRLKIDIDQNIPRKLNIFSGDLQYQVEGKWQAVSMDCRTGSVLDPELIMPAPGSPSMAFGVAGKVSLVNPVPVSEATQLLELANKKMLISLNRNASGSFNVMRLNEDGSVDATFGTAGLVQQAVGSNSIVWKVHELSDGKLLLAGESNGNGALVRLNEDGSLDTSFGVSGIATLDLGGPSDSFSNLQIQPDGKILVSAKWGDDAVAVYAAVVRFEANGSLDVGFAVAGVRKLSSHPSVGLQLESSGRILSASNINTSGARMGFGLNALAAGGQVDLGFGSVTPGSVVFDFGVSEQSLVVSRTQPDGKIILAGRVQSDYGLVRFLANGQVDPTFAAGLGLVTNAYLSDYLHDIVLQPDGKLLVLGGYDSAGPQILRLDDDGQRDSSFANGIPLNPNGPSNTVSKPTDVKEPKSGYFTTTGKLRYVVMMSDGNIAIFETNL